MALHLQVHRTCDRCEKPFDIHQQGIDVPLPKYERHVLTCTFSGPQATDGQAVLFRFEDLCPDCQSVVDNLIGRIKLEKPAPEKPHEKSDGEAKKQDAKHDGKADVKTEKVDAKKDAGKKDPAPSGTTATGEQPF